jgi:hypothetical protein
MPSRSGPKSLYKSDEEAWLDSAINEYLVLVRDKPTDAAVFKEKKMEDFLKHFQTQLVDPNRNLEKIPVMEIGLWRTVSHIQHSPLICRELNTYHSARQGTLQECETPKTPKGHCRRRRPGGFQPLTRLPCLRNAHRTRFVLRG